MTGVPDKATPFPALPIQKCSASSEPSALSLSLAYSGDSAHHCKYSPPKEPILANDTVAFVVAKLNVPQAAGKESKDPEPQTGNVLLEALHVVPIPGDPTVDGYQAHLPDFIRLLIFALSTIAANPEGPADGVVTFPLAVFDFVRGGMKECTLRYVLCVLVLTADPAS